MFLFGSLHWISKGIFGSSCNNAIFLYNTPERSLGSSTTSSLLEITTTGNTPESKAKGKGAKARLSPDLPKGGEVAAPETTGLKNKLPA